MQNDVLSIDIQKIQVAPAVIQFPEYETLKRQALELAANIEQVEVTEENVQVSKKLLAAVNKRVKEMEDKRISIKKEVLTPYNEFEQQVKEIVAVIKNADNIVRDQIRELEEIERDEKRAVIEELFAKRIKHYSFGNTFTFENFIKPTHLTKSKSMKNIESEMVDWLEKIDADLRAISSLPNSEAILTEYYDTKDVTVAIRIVSDREALTQQIKELVVPTNEDVKHAYTITLTDNKDLRIVEMFMRHENIKFKVEKVEI